ncbi:MAG: AAA family ATPase, partial [bacterium]|nr:AAA family ATPase [bacterium]
SHYLPLLEELNTPVFLRPRRFGKSLFTEMLRWYYDIKAAPLFDPLFGNLYIGENPTPLKNSFYFLKMDFSGMSDYSESDKDFINRNFNLCVLGYITGFLRNYSELLNIDESFIDKFKNEYGDNAGEALKGAVQLVNNKEGKVYLVIDEYDALTNALAINYIHASDKDNEYLNITRKGGFFRSFFEAVKGCMAVGLD